MAPREKETGMRENVLDLIGNTPMVRLRKMTDRDCAQVWAKLEGWNPGGSVKDRIALSMIEAAEEEGILKPGGALVEPTSGNTGIGLAMVARIKGYRMILTMPETMSMERRQLLEAYGAELVLTEGARGMTGAVQKAEDILSENPGYVMPQQFKNPSNPAVHRRTTAVEILDALDGPVDGFVAGVGTGGTITGVGEILRERYPSVRIIAVEPDASAVLSGEKPGQHKIAGIGAGFIPDILNTEIYDEIARVTDQQARSTAQRLAVVEGLLVGISSGAAAYAAIKLAGEMGPDKRIVVILPDRGERYLSTGLFSQ